MKKTNNLLIAAAILCGASAARAAGTLPAGYTEVQYIQGDGKSRIKTNYTPNPQTDKAEAVVEWPSGTLTQNQAVWCARTGLNSATWTLLLLNSSGYKFRFDYNTTSGNYLTPAVSADTQYTVTVDRNVVTWSGGDGQTHTAVPGFTAAGTALQLFASHVNTLDAGLGNWGKHRLYSFKVWRSGELIHYFVPCTNATGVATMVDICDNPATLTLAYNGTGAFAAGPEGHYYDDSPFYTGGNLDIAGAPEEIGTPSPAYGSMTGLAAGQEVAVSCGAAVVTNDLGTYEYTCTGWKLYRNGQIEDRQKSLTCDCAQKSYMGGVSRAPRHGRRGG